MSCSLLIGGALVLSYVMPSWSTGSAILLAPIRFSDPDGIDLKLSVHIGLDAVNITLEKSAGRSRKTISLPRFLPQDDYFLHRPNGDIKFNERIKLETAAAMMDQLFEALQRGLPVPILTVLNYLSHQEEGFRWSADYRTAGYYCKFVLTWALICWAWMNIMFLVIPRYGALSMVGVGSLALLAVFIYWILLPQHQLVIHINGQVISFSLGGCFWTVFSVGIVASSLGTVLFMLDYHWPGCLDFDLLIEVGHVNSGHQQVERRLTARISNAGQEIPPSQPAQSRDSVKRQVSVIDSTANSAQFPISPRHASSPCFSNCKEFCGSSIHQVGGFCHSAEDSSSTDASHISSFLKDLHRYFSSEQIPFSIQSIQS